MYEPSSVLTRLTSSTRLIEERGVVWGEMGGKRD